MRLHLNSLVGVMALLLSTAATAQSITQKPVTGADRKKAAAQTTAPATAAQPATTTTQPATTATQPATTSTQPAATATQPATGTPAVETPDEPAAPQSSAPGQTGTTPGQAQASPGQASDITPAQTRQTPSGQPVAADQASASKLTAATAADVKAGVSVFDQKGGVVGKVESVSGDNAVVSAGSVKASIPISSFAKGDNGLVISMTKAEIEAAAKKK